MLTSPPATTKERRKLSTKSMAMAESNAPNAVLKGGNVAVNGRGCDDAAAWRNISYAASAMLPSSPKGGVLTRKGTCVSAESVRCG